MKEIGKMTTTMGLALNIFQMATGMKETGRMEQCMAKEFFTGIMVADMRGTLKMTP